MIFKPTHIVKKTGRKVRVLKIFPDWLDGIAMCHHELILGEPYFYPVNALKEIKNAR